MALKAETIIGDNRIFLVRIYTNKPLKSVVDAEIITIFVPKL